MAKGIGLALAAVLAVVAMSWRAAETHDVREIRLIARGMTFYVDGAGDPNPTLRLRAGETVRLVLRNEDRGMKHDLTVPEWDAATPLVAALRDGSVVVTAPARGTRTVYYCTPHQETMKGTILVE